MALRVALVRGPMYDHLYGIFAAADIDIEVVVHADHPTLNRTVADMLAAGERIDLLATHAKYAPSQSHWLHPLDQLVDRPALDALAPLAVDLCRFAGTLWCVPRLIDVRVLWVRSDRVESAPDTWDDLLRSDTVFGFPGRESGLFGTFFELVAGAGGELFAVDGSPTMETPEAIAAIETLVHLARRAPSDLPTWHYDQVDAALLDGRVDAAAAWPGGWGPISRSPIAEHLEPHLYPAGPSRRVSYSGCHAWAIPRTCVDVDAALSVMHLLMGQAANELDAAGGNVCANEAAFAAVRPSNDTDRRRLDITRRTIDEAMICYPPLIGFPAVEDAGWSSIQAAIEGRISSAEAAHIIQQLAEDVLGEH
jgi:multiple sugar transport system substrate-binding protein